MRRCIRRGTLASAQRLNVRAQAAKSQVAFLLPHAMGDGFYSTAEMYRQAERSIYGVAAQLNAPVVPAGLAWQLVEARHPDIRLRIARVFCRPNTAPI